MNLTQINKITTEFQKLTSWEERARLLIKTGDTLELMDINECDSSNQVFGCENEVWIKSYRINNNQQFKAYCRSRILKGLLALLFIRINGLTKQDLKKIDFEEWYSSLGLQKYLTQSRSNGLKSILIKIQQLI